DATNVEAFTLLGESYLHAGDLERARLALEQARDLDPTSERALALLQGMPGAAQRASGAGRSSPAASSSSAAQSSSAARSSGSAKASSSDETKAALGRVVIEKQRQRAVVEEKVSKAVKDSRASEAPSRAQRVSQPPEDPFAPLETGPGAPV